MTRVAVLTLIVLGFSAAPAAAACLWSNGTYLCTDRSGRTHVAKPRTGRTQRRTQDAVRPPDSVPPSSFGTGTGGFSYGCTMSRC